jgi:hypothetical protein
MRRAAGGLLAIGLAALAAAARADVPVDLELVLAVDISGSMDQDEQLVQRAGYVQALTDPEVLRAIATGVYGRVAFAYVEWAGPEYQFLTVPWTAVETRADAERLADAIAATPLRRFRGTSISGVLAYVRPLFEANGYEGLRHVVDVSGDGPNNMGGSVEAARDRLLADGVTINGLPIMIKAWGGFGTIPDLDRYYADCVVGGPGSFVLPVREPGQLAEAIRQKLILEIAGAPPRAIPAAASPAQAGRADCGIGERQRRMWDP